MDKELEIGKIYEVHHSRKGKFIALLTDVAPAPGDEQDDHYLTVKYDVRQGTDQFRLATQPGQRFRESNLRPSLILRMEEYEEEHWLRNIPVKEPVVEKKKGLFGKLFGK